jgi:hypothetical protein
MIASCDLPAVAIAIAIATTATATTAAAAATTATTATIAATAAAAAASAATTATTAAATTATAEAATRRSTALAFTRDVHGDRAAVEVRSVQGLHRGLGSRIGPILHESESTRLTRCAIPHDCR